MGSLSVIKELKTLTNVTILSNELKVCKVWKSNLGRIILVIFDPIKQLLTLSVFSLSGAQCILACNFHPNHFQLREQNKNVCLHFYFVSIFILFPFLFCYIFVLFTFLFCSHFYFVYIFILFRCCSVLTDELFSYYQIIEWKQIDVAHFWHCHRDEKHILV